MSCRSSRIPALIVTCLLATSCIAWAPVSVGPEALLRQPDPPERIRVTRADGERLVLEAPVLRAGALVATAAPGAVLVSDVRSIEVQRVSVLRTVGVVAPGALLLVIIGKQACRC